MIFRRNRVTRIRVAAILIENEKVLLVAHKKKSNIYWLLPGGGVNFGESLNDALKRELIEELGITVNVGDLGLICDSVDPNGSRHVLNICFNCSFMQGKYTLGNEKRLYNFGFFDQNELQNLQIFPPIKEELTAILEGKVNNEFYLGTRWITL